MTLLKRTTLVLKHLQTLLRCSPN